VRASERCGFWAYIFAMCNKTSTSQEKEGDNKGVGQRRDWPVRKEGDCEAGLAIGY
jgi:hypothetical protein